MLLDALAWNVLNVIRVELIFNCYKLWDIFLHSSFKSPRGQYAVASFVITFLAQFTLQFQFSWLLRIYAIYLSIGICSWLYKRVYFYHRKLDSVGVNQTINNFDANKYHAGAHQVAEQTTNTYMSTFKPPKSKDSGSLNTGGGASGSSSSSSSSSSAAAAASSNGAADTNSLQRQRAVAYRDFRSLLMEPRQNHKEFALSLAHLAHISGLFVDKDVFDEMHFQILATRRDVINIMLRSILLIAATILAYAN